MERKIIKFDDNYFRLRKLAEQKADSGDYISALSLSYASLRKNFSVETYLDIADIYAEMELYELSNKFYFEYMSKTPKEKWPIAYEELAINFFYMDNTYLSSYYFHKKFDADGFISQDGIDGEIIEFFANEFMAKDSFRIVYPPEKANFEKELKQAKRLIVSGDFTGAKKTLEKIPKGCPQYADGLEQLTMLKFITGDIDGGLESGRAYLAETGENLSAYCNLSSIYHHKKDADKSRYYFLKALEMPIKELQDYYKIATCCLEQNEHETSLKYLEHILRERPFDISMRYLYGLALLNCNRFQPAVEQFKELYLINPQDETKLHYLKLAEEALEFSGDNKMQLQPLSYIDDVPENVQEDNQKLIQTLSALPINKMNSMLKRREVIRAVLWGVKKGDEKTVKNSVLILISSTIPSAKEELLHLLIDSEVMPFTKEMILYVLLISGHKRATPIVKYNCFEVVRPKKFPFEKSSEHEIFFSSYAFAFSRLAMTTVVDLNKIAFSTNKVYSKLKNLELKNSFNKEELSALIVLLAEYKEFKSEKDVLRLFDAEGDKYRKLKELYKGEKQC